MSLARIARERRRGRGHADAAAQLLLGVGAYMLYRLVRGLVDGQPALAVANGRRLISLERGLHLFFEPGLQSWALQHRLVVDAATWLYLNSHFVVTTGFLLWLYFARNEAFRGVRNAFLVAMAVALALYAVLPTAPPRLLPGWGFADPVTAQVGPAAARGAALFYNPFAAVPSMHVAFALLIASPAVRLVRPRALKLAWALYPGLVTFVVLVTANHFWLDAVAGALVAAGASGVARAGRRRAPPVRLAWPRRLGGEAPA